MKVSTAAASLRIDVGNSPGEGKKIS